MTLLRDRTAGSVRDDATGLRYLPWYPIAGADDDPPTNPPADPPATPPASPPTSGANDGKAFTQEQVDAIVKDRLERERKKAEADAAKATEAAEAAKLAEQQKWQELAGKHEGRVKELEPVVSERDRYKTALLAQLEAQRKDLPGHILELLDKMDPADQLEYLAKHRAELTKAPDGTRGVPATPSANGQPTDADKVAEAEKKLQATGNYRRGVF